MVWDGEAGRLIAGTEVKIDVGAWIRHLVLGGHTIFLSEVNIDRRGFFGTGNSQTPMTAMHESKDVLQELRSSATNAIRQMLLFIISRLPVYHIVSDCKHDLGHDLRQRDFPRFRLRNRQPRFLSFRRRRQHT